MTNPAIVPFSLRDAPALIEKLLPVQKLSVEVFKERKAGPGQTLTALGGFWKGRKPLIMARACVLGCLLPATGDLERDLEIFEMLMGMDAESLEKRLEEKNSKEGRFILAQHRSVGQDAPYREWVQEASRPEECDDDLYDHVWDEVNAHLDMDAHSFPELVEQLGVMRFGHRPRVADTFCGSGQIPFEAARLGCNAYASDLNPVACMLTWGAFHITGGLPESQRTFAARQKNLAKEVQAEIDRLGVETDGKGWQGKSYLYCLETKCPQTGWSVPLLPTRVVSRGRGVIAELQPDPVHQRYEITLRCGVSQSELSEAEVGTVRSDGRGQDTYLVHVVKGIEYRTKISTLRGDFRNEDGSTGNRLRLWDRDDFMSRPGDIFWDRLYAIHWKRQKEDSKKEEFEFRAVTQEDLARERTVVDFVAKRIAEWQDNGWIPDMRIEPGVETTRLFRERGWTHWHHLFPPRHLLLLALMRSRVADAQTALLFTRVLDYTSKLCRWTTSNAGNSGQGAGKRTGGASDNPSNVFYNQALNTFYNYGCRSSSEILELFTRPLSVSSIAQHAEVVNVSASESNTASDIFITDPPYGDAVKYEEILEFFIAWLRKNPPPEFAGWVWDSRRSLAIQGDDEAFRRNMVAAYRRMAELMPDNGIQVIMFTHQSGAIWADMANIVWASGLQVTAAWYVVTETDSALREGSYVKGTVLLVVRKRRGSHKIGRGDLAWEIQEEVEAQVQTLTGLNQQAKGLYRDENLFEDADIQMAGYAAALRVLTRYAIIDGRDMAAEALRPRVRGQTTFVDDLIEFAVSEANRALVPQGIAREHWERLLPAERFYLKLIELEARGQRTLDNYQNFAKAFKVRDFKPFMASERANAARLKGAAEFGRSEMGETSELYDTPLRAVLYALMELERNVDGEDVLQHLALNHSGYYGQRERVVEIAGYLAGKLEALRPDEASAARVLRDLVRNQRM